MKKQNLHDGILQQQKFAGWQLFFSSGWLPMRYDEGTAIQLKFTLAKMEMRMRFFCDFLDL